MYVTPWGSVSLFSIYQKTVNDTTVSAISHQLLNISKRAREYSDPLDVVYGAEVVKKLAQVIGRDQVVSLLQELPVHLLNVHVI